MNKYQELIKDAKKHMADGNVDEAIILYEEAFENTILVEDLIDLGFAYLNNQLPSRSIDVFTAVVNTFPSLAYGYYGLGLSLEALSKNEEAYYNYELAVQKEIDFADAYFSMALIDDEAGDDKKAYKNYSKTLLYNPNHYWANLNLGSFYERNNYLELAQIHTEKAHRQNPNEKMVNYNLGVISAKLKEYDKAINYYKQELIQKDPYILAYLNLGILYKDVKNDLRTAKETYQEGISKDKDNATLWYNLACIYALEHDYDNCYSCLLYSIIRDRTSIDYMENDPELIEFRSTTYYDKLKKSIN